jgi:ubiquinone biosynthesis protein
MRDELGPEAAIADRCRAWRHARLPALLDRIEDAFPAKGGAPEPPPLPDVPLIWEHRVNQSKRLAGYIAAFLLGGAVAWLALRHGWAI